MTQRGVVLTGATKFIGRHALAELLARGVPVACLVRPGSDAAALRALGVTLIEGDLNRPEGLAERLKGYGSLIHIPNLASMSDMAGLLRAYEAAGLARVVFVSSTGIFTELPARTKPRRQEAEALIRSCGLNYTILRPTMVYGGRDDGNIARLLRFCQRSPVMPIFGSGEAKQQPVHVDDLAWAMVAALQEAKTSRQSYNLGGGQVLSYNSLVAFSYRALGRRGVLLHLPAKSVAAGVRTAAKLGLSLPLREEQILRLEEDKAYDIAPAQADFAYAPRTFERGVDEQAQRLLEINQTRQT